MPLDSSTVLIGASHTLDSVPDNLPEIIAGCSLEHFIVADNTEEIQKLHDKIGANAELVTKAEMSAVMKDVLDDINVL